MEALARWERLARILHVAPQLEERRAAQRMALCSLGIPKVDEKLPVMTASQRQCGHLTIINKANQYGIWKYCQNCLLRTTYMATANAVKAATAHQEQAMRGRRRTGRSAMTRQEAREEVEQNMGRRQEARASDRRAYEGVPPGAGNVLNTAETLTRMEALVAQTQQHMAQMQAQNAQHMEFMQAQQAQSQEFLRGSVAMTMRSQEETQRTTEVILRMEAMMAQAQAQTHGAPAGEASHFGQR